MINEVTTSWGTINTVERSKDDVLIANLAGVNVYQISPRETLHDSMVVNWEYILKILRDGNRKLIGKRDFSEIRLFHSSQDRVHATLPTITHFYLAVDGPENDILQPIEPTAQVFHISNDGQDDFMIRLPGGEFWLLWQEHADEVQARNFSIVLQGIFSYSRYRVGQDGSLALTTMKDLPNVPDIIDVFEEKYPDETDLVVNLHTRMLTEQLSTISEVSSSLSKENGNTLQRSTINTLSRLIVKDNSYNIEDVSQYKKQDYSSVKEEQVHLTPMEHGESEPTKMDASNLNEENSENEPLTSNIQKQRTNKDVLVLSNIVPSKETELGKDTAGAFITEKASAVQLADELRKTVKGIPNEISEVQDVEPVSLKIPNNIHVNEATVSHYEDEPNFEMIDTESAANEVDTMKHEFAKGTENSIDDISDEVPELESSDESKANPELQSEDSEPELKTPAAMVTPIVDQDSMVKDYVSMHSKTSTIVEESLETMRNLGHGLRTSSFRNSIVIVDDDTGEVLGVVQDNVPLGIEDKEVQESLNLIDSTLNNQSLHGVDRSSSATIMEETEQNSGHEKLMVRHRSTSQHSPEPSNATTVYHDAEDGQEWASSDAHGRRWSRCEQSELVPLEGEDDAQAVNIDVDENGQLLVTSANKISHDALIAHPWHLPLIGFVFSWASWLGNIFTLSWVWKKPSSMSNALANGPRMKNGQPLDPNRSLSLRYYDNNGMGRRAYLGVRGATMVEGRM